MDQWKLQVMLCVMVSLALDCSATPQLPWLRLPLPPTGEDFEVALEESSEEGEGADYPLRGGQGWGEMEERGLQERGLEKKYYPLCDENRSTVELRDVEYDYLPRYYEAVECRHSGGPATVDYSVAATCPAQNCIQKKGEIHVVRRRKGAHSNCWEPHTIKEVKKSCECMAAQHEYIAVRKKKPSGQIELANLV